MKPIGELHISPWPWEKLSGLSTFVIDGDSNTITDDYDGGMNKVEDARMTAAAPEMYEALAAMLHCAEKEAPWPSDTNMAIAMDMARKALAKAAGEKE